jgi:hypothetical protein
MVYLSSLDPPLLPTIALAMKILPLIVPVHWRWLFIGIYAQSKRLQAVRIEHGDSGMAKRILGCDPRKTDVSRGSYRAKNKEVRATRRGRTDVSRDLGHCPTKFRGCARAKIWESPGLRRSIPK